RGIASGQASEVNACCNAQAADTASEARENTAKRLSPSPRLLTKTPACRVIVAEARVSWRLKAIRIASGFLSKIFVLASMSVKRNVTIPLGKFMAVLDRNKHPICKTGRCLLSAGCDQVIRVGRVIADEEIFHSLPRQNVEQ